MRITALALACLALTGLALTGCASTDGYVDHNDNLLEVPRQNETLAEQLQREIQDGCLSGGSSSDAGCRRERERLDDILGPPRFPDGAEIERIPPPPAQPDGD